jgi:hypothetical protein
MNLSYKLPYLVQAIVAVNCLAVAQGQIARLTLHSQAGDFIGQGGNYDIMYTPDNSSFFSPQVRGTIGAGLPAELLFVLGTVTGGSDNTFALLFFGTDQLGIPMQPGVYLNAERADFASPGHAGLDLSFQNRGCNIVEGNFTVTEATFGPDNTIQTFAASFEQHCEGLGPALSGTFTFGAVPEPSSLALVTCFGLLALAYGKLRRR